MFRKNTKIKNIYTYSLDFDQITQTYRGVRTAVVVLTEVYLKITFLLYSSCQNTCAMSSMAAQLVSIGATHSQCMSHLLRPAVLGSPESHA